ncbi:MAG: N-acetyltransferase [Rhizobiales bacterium]|nr:N-acetyltransferase [Hyphomicrobiales bacterium]
MSIVRDEARGRYELPLGSGDIAVAVFHKRGGALAITHTEVPAHLEGRGHGSALMAAVLTDVRARGEKVRPLCSFARAYMRRHPETQDLLA